MKFDESNEDQADNKIMELDNATGSNHLQSTMNSGESNELLGNAAAEKMPD